MQNEPNFRKSQMNVTDLLTRVYEEKYTWWSGKKRSQNKPKQTLFQRQKNAALNLFAVGCRAEKNMFLTVKMGNICCTIQPL